MRNMGRRVDRRSLTGTIAVACLVGAGMFGGGAANATETPTLDPVEAEVAQSDAEAGDDADPRVELLEQIETTIASLGVNDDASSADAAATADEPVNMVSSGMWGQAPWSFDVSTGVLTVTGSVDGDSRLTLGVNLTQPWNSPIVSPDVAAKDIKVIVLENPTGIAFPANSAGLFSSLNGIAGSQGHPLPNLTEIEGIGQVEVSNVTNMTAMFYGASSLTTLDVSKWNTSNVTTMNRMFSGAKSLTTLDVSKWNTSKVTNMDHMFLQASSLTELDVLKWDTSKVTSMSRMFSGASSLTELDVSEWDTSKVRNFQDTFELASKLTTLDVSKWDTSNVTVMNSMFRGASGLTTLDVSKWDTSKVTNMNTMFSGASSLTTLDVSKWDTSNVTNMNTMFRGASSLTTLDVSKWDTSNVTNMSIMFYGASSLTTLDVSKWDTSNVTSMAQMFRGPISLTTLDVSKWDTSNVTNMSIMFSGASSLTTLDVSKWDTSNVTTMSNMFRGASGLTTLDVSKWDTSKVTNMYTMFSEATSLRTLKLGGKSKILATADLPSVQENETNTGKWVLVSPEVAADSWWRGSSTELIERSATVLAPGTYVWQQKAPVIFDLGDGKWAEDSEPEGVKKAAQAGVGDLVTIPDYSNDPVREGFKFAGWETDSPAEYQVTPGKSFVLTEPGKTTLTAKWEKNLVEVTPEAPEEVPAEKCGVEKTVLIPEVEGVEYSQSRKGTTVTVTATALDGYKLAEGADTSWTFDVAAELCELVPGVVIVTPEAPEEVPAEKCGVEKTVLIPEVEGVEYSQSRKGTTVTVTATALDGYKLAEGADTSWTFDVAAELCELVPGVVIVTPEAPEEVPAEKCGVEKTVLIPEVEGVEYTQGDVVDGKVIVTATAKDGYVIADGAQAEWTLEVAAEECEGEPGEVEDLVLVTFDLNGGAGYFRPLVAELDPVSGEKVVHIHGVEPLRDGYEFIGWLPVPLTRSSGFNRSDLIQPGADHTPSGNTVLMAQWEPTSVEPTEPPTEPGGTVDPTDPAGATDPDGSGNGAAGTSVPSKGAAAGSASVSGGLAQTGGSVTPFALGASLLLIAGLGLFAARRGRAAGK